MTDGGLNASQGYWLFKMYEVSNWKDTVERM